MKIGLALDQFDPRRGGAEQWTAQFASRLIARGHEVHVVARRFGRQALETPIVAHPLPQVRSGLAFARAAEAKLRSLRADVVHDLGWGWYCDVFQPRGGSWTANAEQKLLWLPRLVRPLKRHTDRLLPRHRRFRALQKRQYADRGQIVVAQSQMVSNDFQRLHGVSPQRIRVIYNGVDTNRFSPEICARHRWAVRRRLGIDDRAVVLLIVAHNHPLKGVPTLLRVMRRLTARRAPAHLVVVGGRHTGRYVFAAKRLRHSEAVTFVGPIDDTVPLYAAADVYVHPTFYDSFGLAILEAAACGLPVITSRFAGAAELFSEGVEGHVLRDPADVEELLSRLVPLFDPAVRRRMGEAARRMALKHPFDRNVEQILALYGEIGDAGRRAA